MSNIIAKSVLNEQNPLLNDKGDNKQHKVQVIDISYSGPFECSLDCICGWTQKVVTEVTASAFIEPYRSFIEKHTEKIYIACKNGVSGDRKQALANAMAHVQYNADNELEYCGYKLDLALKAFKVSPSYETREELDNLVYQYYDVSELKEIQHKVSPREISKVSDDIRAEYEKMIKLARKK